MGTVVRAATTADLDQVAAIYAHYVATSVATFEEEPPAVAYWQQRLGDLTARDLPFLVAAQDEAVLGYSFASPWRLRPAYRHTVEDSVYVTPGLTGRGIGAALLGALLSRCTAVGVRQVIAVIADNGSDASAVLHQRFGFARAGLLAAVGRKHGRWIDTLLMQRDLTDTELHGDRVYGRGAGVAQAAGEAERCGAAGDRGQAVGGGTATTRRYDH